MQTMPEDVKIPDLNDNVLTTVVRLLNDARARNLAQPLLDAVTAIEEANIAANRLRNPEIIAREWMEIYRKPIVTLVSSLELDTQKVVERKVKQEPYATLFKDHNVDSHRTDEPEDLKKEIERKIKVIKSLPANSILRPAVPELQKALKTWKPYVYKHVAAQKALDKATKTLANRIKAVGRLLLATHGELEKVLGDRKLVETFFVPWRVDKKKKKAAQPQLPPPGNGGSTPPPAPPAGS